jgi:two-component system sporulation sensor kinase A/two-component system, sporulation sensor kinase E
MPLSRAIDLGGVVLFVLGVLFLAIAYGILLRARRRTSQQTMDDVSRTRRMLEGAVEDAADAILLLDPDGRIRGWNRGASDTFGYAAPEAIGQPYAMLLPAGATIETALTRNFAEVGIVRDLRTSRRRKDGTQFEVSITRSQIRVPAGQEAGFVEILRDITRQRELERELIHAEKMAAVGKIASKVVHEIRNPLGSINLNCDLLIDNLGAGQSPEEREAREILGTIKRETRRLTQITEEYLQFSRMPQPTGREEDLNVVLLELADFLRPELRRSGIRLVLNLDDRRPLVACDSRLLRQVILNLVRNAMDVVPAQSGQVMVVSVAERNGARIEVDDNGPGIPPEVLPRIFEPFFTTKQDGTGLGLAVVRQIVEEHSGTVTCSSLPGKGTTFRIWLPGRSDAIRR